MSKEIQSTRYYKEQDYKLFILKHNDPVDVFGRFVGKAKRDEQRAFYRVKFDEIPESEFYLVKSQYDDDRFMVLSSIKKTSDGYKFSNLVGSGEVVEIDKTSMPVILFNIHSLGSEFQMNLMPIKGKE